MIEGGFHPTINLVSVLSDVLGGKDVVEGHDGQTDGRFCLLGIGRNGQILWIFYRICSNMLEYARICSNMLEYLLIGWTWTLSDVTDGRTDEMDGRTHRQPWVHTNKKIGAKIFYYGCLAFKTDTNSRDGDGFLCMSMEGVLRHYQSNTWCISFQKRPITTQEILFQIWHLQNTKNICSFHKLG
jgi:hypothetical protein